MNTWRRCAAGMRRQGWGACGVVEELHAVEGDGVEGGAGVSICLGCWAALLGSCDGCVVVELCGRGSHHSHSLCCWRRSGQGVVHYILNTAGGLDVAGELCT